MKPLSTLWSQLGHPRLLVVGDLLLDRYSIGEAERISPEAPVLVLREDGEEVRLGGAANVAALLRGLETEVVLAGVVGEDHAGRTLLHLADEVGIDHSAVIPLPDRPTTTKQRFVGRSGHRTPHQLLRVDREIRTPLGHDQEQQLKQAIATVLPTVASILISDYAKGVCTPSLLRWLIDEAAARNLPVVIDPARVADPERYAGATWLKPNRIAAELWMGQPLRDRATILAATEALRGQLRLKAAVVTLDRDGLAFADAHQRDILAGRPRDVCDVTGAGDMVQAMLGFGAAEGCSLRDSLSLANAAAGLEVEHYGVVPLSRAEIASELRGPGSTTKIASLTELVPLREHAARLGQTVVFTNGCFDLLHPGHVQMLQAAAELGDLLIVAVNNDASVQRLKGSERPVLSESDRAGMLAALACVDHVLIFREDTPHHLLHALRPDILVKGGTTADITGREIVEAYGGQVMQLSTVGDWSTTNLVRQITEHQRTSAWLMT